MNNKNVRLLLKTILSYSISQMKQKTARFNYLEDKQGGTEGKIDSERYEYRHIINKLTKEHHYQDVLKEYYKDQLNKDKRDTSPFSKNTIHIEDKKNSQIKSIILNQHISLQKIKIQKNESNIQKRDAYRMIKESHIVKDQDFQQFYQNSKSPTHHYQQAPKEAKAPDYKYSYNPIKFYQIKLEHTPPKKKINSHKNNEPYINQLYNGNSSSSYSKAVVNPQARNHSPLRIGATTESQIKNNRAYKVQKSQQKSKQKLYDRYYDQKQDRKKRSCFDYVPKQLKQKLTRARQHEY